MSREVFHYTWCDEFSRYPIFVDGTFILHFVLLFVLRIRWRLHISDAEPSYNFNTLWPRRNEQHFADDIFKRIFFNENIWISIKISLKFVPKGPIKNIPALVQIMAWRRSGDKPLSEPMMVSLPTHICVTRPRWVKTISLQICHNIQITREFTAWQKLISGARQAL